MSGELGQKTMSHDVVEVDMETFLRGGETPNIGRSRWWDVLGGIRNATAIFVGEIPHSQIDTIGDYAAPPVRPNFAKKFFGSLVRLHKSAS